MKKRIGAVATALATLGTTPAMAFTLNDVGSAMQALNQSSNQQQTAPASTAGANGSGLSQQVLNAFGSRQADQSLSSGQQATIAGTTSGNLQQASDLISTLTGQLGVTRQQAIGGSAALLASAKNQLSSDQFNQLSNQAPGIDGLLSSARAASSASGGSGSVLSTLSGLTGGSNAASGNGSLTSAAFNALGISSSVASQFAPTLLQYFSGQGVGSGLLSQLAGIWNTTLPTSGQ
ncbi:DUF2780 domain-containing protein [Kushneria phosphatilytica]|uniref:DUF2780 domain-containing protein n=1 Tax=Kushneria phosphatilytica TaxID=657387 RepID=A0A1S1NML0_9GAMM|nr:DUF2780 domain-containing protein [Kushneria phosphatilytica]OHV08395.1 hypothetical protein BH688_13880 [Kushneria phosphatilytica]QEL09818.1 DUF2780 domain-containing protein [Kushneria phosphatilytica]